MKNAMKKMFAAVSVIAVGLAFEANAYAAPAGGSGNESVAQIELALTNLAAQSSQAQAELAQARAQEIAANAKMIAALDDAINTQKKYDDALARVNEAKKIWAESPRQCIKMLPVH
ncbi:hypothetical protein RQN30_09240 [Arcanobacterium hippocoleae]